MSGRFELTDLGPASRQSEITAQADHQCARDHAQQRHAWLVLTEGERVIGYAYGGPFRARPAYAWSCEVSVYLARDRHRTGGGRALYTALLSRLTHLGLHTALAGIAVGAAGADGDVNFTAAFLGQMTLILIALAMSFIPTTSKARPAAATEGAR